MHRYARPGFRLAEIEFSLRLPSEHLFAGGMPRPLARRALADQVPAAVLDARNRGMHTADWFERADLAEVRGNAEEILASPADRALVDFDRLNAAIGA